MRSVTTVILDMWILVGYSVSVGELRAYRSRSSQEVLRVHE